MSQQPFDLTPLLPFAAVFSDPDFDFGTWEGGQTHQGTMQFAYFAFSEGANAFVRAAYEGNWVRPEIAWSTWAASDEYKQLRSDPTAMANASASDIAHMLTTLIRGDRFNEGLLAKAFEERLLHRILDRAAHLAHPAGEGETPR